MEKSNFLDKYTIYSHQLLKSEVSFKSADEIMEVFKKKISEHKVAKFVAIFDNYAHTKELNGEINESIKDCKIIIFCFGRAIPNSKILAVRPRNIAVTEFEDRFVIEFQEAPKDDIQSTMQEWILSLGA